MDDLPTLVDATCTATMIAKTKTMAIISSMQNVTQADLIRTREYILHPLTRRLSSQVGIGLGFTGAFFAVAAILLVGCYLTSRTQDAWRSRPPIPLPSVDSGSVHEDPVNMPPIDEHHNAPSSTGAGESAVGVDPEGTEHP